jgi:FtsP/CotA-like multicopper oxidase with cupredoxin domain
LTQITGSNAKIKTRLETATGYSRALRYPTAILTLGAAAIHSSVIISHFNEYVPFGLFFVAVTVSQLALVWATLIRPGRKLFAGAILGTVCILAIWLISRASGLPFGPTPGRPEPTGLADIITAIFEAVSILLFGLLTALGPRPQRKGRGCAVTLATGPTLLLGTILSFVGVLSGANPLPEAINMGSAVPGQPSISVTSLTEPPGAEPLKEFTLTTQVAKLDGHEVWTYNGTVPGPELRVTEGDRVRITLINHLPASTSIHWHGLRLPNAEDGVVGITQNAVAPGSTYTYEFVVKDPGTFWYHSHQDTQNQVPRGLYGALVVEPKQGPYYDRDYSVIIGDAQNDLGDLHLDAQPGETVRLRVISAFQEDMTGTPELLVLTGASYKVVALDGHDLNQPQELGPEVLPIGTGQRYDLVFTMPSTGQVKLFDERPKTGQRDPRTNWVSLGEGAAPELADSASLPKFDLTTYGAPANDPVAARKTFDVSQDLAISNTIGIRYGTYQFIQMFNGKSFPDTQTILVREGQYVRLRIINQTDLYHPIHLHGHFFSVISKNGTRITGSPVHLDSILVGPHETWEVAFLADNPGLWMLHCHVLVHATYGLSTMVSYVGISTPYAIGWLSGNFPE